ncbi:mitochondrial amidoxime reducing component 2-like [Lytechinus variegatus]|uniref:mitochondrial amidoxime reducing component 2-like n=1 Tax=Lytechinus variegatus TaxID=7654 RepID=UPI001BB163D1|nr:mitochondrial amidoxime reducing component 2-like [Lytechinus variegatus]
MPEFTNSNLVLGGLAACAVGVLGISYIYLRREKRKYTQVGVVSKLFIHPIKSCRGLEVSQAECVALGIKSDGLMDRSFVIICPEGRFVTQRQQPSIALIAPSLSDDKESLLINAPGMPTLTVPLKDQNGPVYNIRIFKLPVDGEDCGHEASEWLSQYLGKPGYKLIRHSKRFKGKILRDDPTWGSKAKRGEQATYQDLAQVNILSAASLESLNSKLDKPVQLRNFRPNIVVEGTTAYCEDNWKYVCIGTDALLRTTHLCDRCRQTTVDPDTGTFYETGEPLKTLKTYRMAPSGFPDQKRHGFSPLFGTQLAVESQGTIKLGDPVFASME